MSSIRTLTRAAAVLCAVTLSGCPAPPVRLLDDGGARPFAPFRDAGPGAPDAGGDDAGVVDAGPDDDDAGVVVDAGPPPPGVGLHGACDDTILRCDEALVCVGAGPGTTGVCELDCGQWSGTTLTELPEFCPELSSCQTLWDARATMPVLAACLPIEYVRDRECLAFEDDDACALDRVCIANDTAQTDDGEVIVERMVCRDTCVYGAPDAGDACPIAADECLPDPVVTVAAEYQLTNPTNPASYTTCLPASCTPGGPACTCDVDDGFRCVPALGTTLCARPRGLCGTTAPYVGFGVPITVANLCNEDDGHRFCDRRPYMELDDGALSLCLGPVGGAPLPSDGICIALCAQDAFDYDGDGSVGYLTGEGGFERSCAPDEVCDRSYSISIGLFTAGDEEVACDPTVCPPHEPCGTCPSGVACVSSPYFVTAPSVCAAVFATCQPAPPAPPDAGVVDAGAPDAGPPADAGVVDAGALDAGPLDAGPLDAGLLDAGLHDAGLLDAGQGDAG